MLGIGIRMAAFYRAKISRLPRDSSRRQRCSPNVPAASSTIFFCHRMLLYSAAFCRRRGAYKIWARMLCDFDTTLIYARKSNRYWRHDAARARRSAAPSAHSSSCKSSARQSSKCRQIGRFRRRRSFTLAAAAGDRCRREDSAIERWLARDTHSVSIFDDLFLRAIERCS